MKKTILLLLVLLIIINTNISYAGKLTIINTDDIGKALNLSNKEIIIGNHKFSVFDNISAMSLKSYQAEWLPNSSFKRLTVYLTVTSLNSSNNFNVSLKGVGLIDKYYTKPFNFNLSHPNLTTLPTSLNWSYSTTYNIVNVIYSNITNETYNNITGELIDYDEVRYYVSEKEFYNYQNINLNTLKNFVNSNKFNKTFLDPDVGCGTLNLSNTEYTLNQSLNSTGTCFNIMNANNINLSCNGYAINYSRAGVLGYGINFTNVNNSVIKDCVIFEGNTSGGNAKNGIQSTAWNYNITVKNTSINTLAGYSVYGYYSGNLINNTFTTTATTNAGSIYNAGGVVNVINNSITTLGTGNGLYISSSNPNAIIYNNYFNITNGYGMWLNNFNNANITDNNIYIYKYGVGLNVQTKYNHTVENNYVNGLPLNYSWRGSGNKDFSVSDADLTIYGQMFIAEYDTVEIINSNLSSNGIFIIGNNRTNIINSTFNNTEGNAITSYHNNVFISNNFFNGTGTIMYLQGVNNTIEYSTIYSKPSSISTNAIIVTDNYDIDNNNITCYSNYCVYLNFADNGTITNNNFANNNTANIRAQNSKNITYINNTFRLLSASNTAIVLQIDSNSFPSYIINNSFFRNSSNIYACIDAGQLYNSSVINNTMINIVTGYGLNSASATINSTISGNKINSSSIGLRLLNIRNSEISDNNISTTTNNAIYMANANNTVLNNNYLTTNATSIITLFFTNVSNINMTNMNVISTNNTGFFMNRGNYITIINSTFTGKNADINFTNSSNNIDFINSTFNISKALITVNDSYNVYWYLRAYANDTNGNPLQNVLINISNDTVVNIDVQNTLASGYTNFVTLKQYFRNGSDYYYNSNYTINATYNSTQQNDSFNLSNSLTMVYTFISAGEPIVNIIRTMIGSASSWIWGEPTDGISVVRSGTAKNWTWRTYTLSSGRMIPNGTANNWNWINE